MLKVCSRCDQPKSVDEFYRNRSKKDGLAVWCKPCTRAYNNGGRAVGYYRKVKGVTPERIAEYQRRTRLKTRYGLTEQDYEALLEIQGGRCFICLREVDYRLFVDHDHRTGRVRGLLCAKCNGALGWLEKHVERISFHLKVVEPDGNTTC